MTIKDWILLLLPIVFNGIILVIFQKFVIDKYIKHRMLKDEIVKEFLDMLKDLISYMIQSNFESMNDGDSINNNVSIMQKKLVEMQYSKNTFMEDRGRFGVLFSDPSVKPQKVTHTIRYV